MAEISEPQAPNHYRTHTHTDKLKIVTEQKNKKYIYKNRIHHFMCIKNERDRGGGHSRSTDLFAVRWAHNNSITGSSSSQSGRGWSWSWGQGGREIKLPAALSLLHCFPHSSPPISVLFFYFLCGQCTTGRMLNNRTKTSLSWCPLEQAYVCIFRFHGIPNWEFKIQIANAN